MNSKSVESVSQDQVCEQFPKNQGRFLAYVFHSPTVTRTPMTNQITTGQPRILKRPKYYWPIAFYWRLINADTIIHGVAVTLLRRQDGLGPLNAIAMFTRILASRVVYSVLR